MGKGNFFSLTAEIKQHRRLASDNIKGRINLSPERLYTFKCPTDHCSLTSRIAKTLYICDDEIVMSMKKIGSRVNMRVLERFSSRARS